MKKGHSHQRPVEYMKYTSFVRKAGYQLSRALDSESKHNKRCVYSTCMNKPVYHRTKNLSVCNREMLLISVTVHTLGRLPVVKRNLIFLMIDLGFSPTDTTGFLFLNPFKWESDWLKGRVGAGWIAQLTGEPEEELQHDKF